MNVGIIGLGNVSTQYLATIERLDILRLAAVADADADRAKNVAAAQRVRPLSVRRLLADADVDLVINLTTPAAHAEITTAAITAGKSVFSEKPLATNLPDAKGLVDLARSAGVRLGCSPDTVIGTGVQTARRAVDDGLIGGTVAATASMLIPGHEHWHPNPDFFYQPGAGPLLDRGPYEITTLLTILGPVVEVGAMSSRPHSSRRVRTGARTGETFPVAVDTHVTGSLRHASGVISTIIMSFDAVATKASNVEIHGTDASLIVPNPNKFDGDVLLRRLGEPEWSTLPVSAGYIDAARGYGAADLAATAPGDERASATVALHALDVMISMLRSAEIGRVLPLSTTCERPLPVPLGAIPERRPVSNH